MAVRKGRKKSVQVQSGIPLTKLGFNVLYGDPAGFVIEPRGAAVVPTGIAIEIVAQGGEAMGALLRDKSSLAARRLITTAGVIDAGYRGEIKVVMENLSDASARIAAGDKIANLIPYPVLTGNVQIVQSLGESSRKAGGFGSSGSQ